ncbi:MAG: iron transporter [Pseudomonadota bacterium]
MKRTTSAWVPILSRTVAALIGGYAFTYAFTAALARLLPLDNVDSLIVASLLSFVIYTFAILWAFAARRQWSAWMGAVLAVPLAVIGFWPQLMGRLG